MKCFKRVTCPRTDGSLFRVCRVVYFLEVYYIIVFQQSNAHFYPIHNMKTQKSDFRLRKCVFLAQVFTFYAKNLVTHVCLEVSIVFRITNLRFIIYHLFIYHYHLIIFLGGLWV